MGNRKWKTGRNIQRTLGARVTNLPSLPGTKEFHGTFQCEKCDSPRQTRTVGQPTQCLEGIQFQCTGTKEVEAGNGVGKRLSWDRTKTKTYDGWEEDRSLSWKLQALQISLYLQIPTPRFQCRDFKEMCITCFYTCSFSNTCALFYSSVSQLGESR